MNAKIRNRILTLTNQLGVVTNDMVQVVFHYFPKNGYWTCSILWAIESKVPYFYIHQNVSDEMEPATLYRNSMRISSSSAFSGIASLECMLKFYLNQKTKNRDIAQVEVMLERRVQELKDQFHNEQERKAATRRKPLAK